MSAIKRLWDSITNLATSLQRLAETVQTVNDQVQNRLGSSVDPGVPLLSNGEPEAATRKRKA